MCNCHVTTALGFTSYVMISLFLMFSDSLFIEIMTELER